MERRIIAIQMLPKAYDEIQRLKGEETWTRFIIQCVLAKVGDNSILQDELASLTKEPKVEKPKKVLIAGGGPAGMEAAIVAVQRNHEVLLYERSKQLGGLLPFAAIFFSMAGEA